MRSPKSIERLRVIAGRLAELDEALEAAQAGAAALLATIPRSYAPSATNLVHYMALRRFDLRELQMELASLGLSSLGRSESHVRAGIESLRATVAALLKGIDGEPRAVAGGVPVGFEEAGRLAQHRAAELLGPTCADRRTRILVTMPPEAADPFEGPVLLRRLVAAGMDAVRINCSHDGEAAWSAMVLHVRAAAAEAGRPVRVLVDIPGPKVRTGPLPPGPPVARWRPQRDELGRAIRPAIVALVRAPEELAGPLPPGTQTALCLTPEFLDALSPGAVLRLRDTRARTRHLEIIDRTPAGMWRAEAWETGYAAPGTVVRLCERSRELVCAVRATPRPPGAVTLCAGDRLLLTAADGPAPTDARPALHRVSCTLPEAIAFVRPGDRVSFDDGKISGVAEEVWPEAVKVRITQARPQGSKLRADRGINFPDTPLEIPAITGPDREVLRFAARHADLVGLSFVSRVEDVRDLARELASLGAGGRVGIVLKIETQRAFQRLPALLLEAMRTPPVGVMIARGDLAVECGFERLAEVQEEILWLCEAAHVPTIWATQVLESMAKKGTPSRAEVTDAAMAERAECAMLNKGPYIVEAVRTLDDILRRMSNHQHKKRAMLRPLRVASGFGEESAPVGHAPRPPADDPAGPVAPLMTP